MEPCQSVSSEIFIPYPHHFEPSTLTNPAKMFPLLCLAVIKTDDGAGVLVAVFCRQQQQRWQLWPSPRLLYLEQPQRCPSYPHSTRWLPPRPLGARS